jgi:hypothetical protein
MNTTDGGRAGKPIGDDLLLRHDHLRRRILLHDVLNLLLVRRPIFLEQIERIGLRRRLRVRLIQQRLNAQQNILDRNRRFPALFLIENRETNRARRVDVWVEQRGYEFA